MHVKSGNLLLFVAIILAMSSCVSMKKVKYLQDVSEYQMSDTTVFGNATNAEYKVQPGDNLYVDVKSMDSKNLNPFEANQRVAYQSNNEMSIYLNSYMVSDSGFINFPIVGKIKVEGLTVNEIKTRLQNTVNEFFQLTTVTVKLVNFKISLLGEVLRPGTYIVYQENINILQAISMAGDLTPYAKRSNVMIIRKSGGGSTVTRVNLLTSDILNSPDFYLQPDDIVYVEPLNSKNYAFTSFPYSVVLSTITTTLLILTFFK